MKLKITESERAEFAAKKELGIDSRGNEVLIGLDYDESNRHIRFVREPMIWKEPDEKADAAYLSARHQRAMVFWNEAMARPDTNKEMTAEDAFEIGRNAWKAYAGAVQFSDFSEMIGSVPVPLRLAALNGWLNAFDDEADRLKAAKKRGR